MAHAALKLLESLGAHVASAEALSQSVHRPSGLVLGWAELDAALPEGGLPRGVVELASPGAMGGATSVALAAIRAVHAKDARAWCAWIDPEATLYAPGLARAGVDLARLLVVRPPREELARVAVKVTSAHAFDVVAVDFDPIPGAGARTQPERRTRKRAWPSEVFVRKLALSAGEGGSTVLLLTDSRAERQVPWPVAMRLELVRERDAISVRVAKDRRGGAGIAKTVPLATQPLLHVEAG